MRLFTMLLTLATLTATAAEVPVRVGEQFAVRAVVEPAVTQIDGDDAPLATVMPDGPYVYVFEYARDLIRFVGAADGATAEFTEVENSPLGRLRVTSDSPESVVRFRAMKAISEPVTIPVDEATAAGEAIDIVNDDTLLVGPRAATLRILIEQIELD
jgi:hypothetical protein